jgi:hypothetical protein
MILAWNSAEAGFGVIRSDAEGRKKWGARSLAASRVACDGERLFVSHDRGDVGIRVYDARDCRPLAFGREAACLPPPGGDPEANRITGLACRGVVVYAALRARNLVVLYDGREGSLRTTWSVPAPGSVAARPDGSIVMISDGKLVAIDDGGVSLLAEDHLDDPAGIALDTAGRIYVANRGQGQNVSVFSSGGAYERSIGKPGGRPRVGRFDPAGMLEPGGLAIDVKGRLWVAEAVDAPKRISVWDVETGALVNEFFGGAHYSAFIWMDPQRPDEIYCDRVIWKVDLEKKTWAPASTFWRAGNDPDSPGEIATHMGGFRVVTAVNGRQYGWASCFRAHDNPRPTVLFMRTGDVFKPIVSITATTNSPLIASVSPKPHGAAFAWADRNDDQVMQADELSAPLGSRWTRGFGWVDRDLNLWFPDPPSRVKYSAKEGTYLVFEKTADAGGCVYRPLRFEPDGRPVYDFSRPEPTPVSVRCVDDVDGSWYLLRSYKPPAERIGYARYTPSGELQWGYRGAIEWISSLSLPPQKPGKIWAPTAPLGTAGDFTGFNTYFGVAHLYTRDGLYVAKLFADPRVATGLGPDVIRCENMNGQLVRPRGMDRTFLLAGDVDGRVTEVLGLETVKRLEGGTYTISEPDARRAVEAAAAFEAEVSHSAALDIARGREGLESAPAVGKAVHSRQSFLARAAYDATNLYVQVEVTGPSELLNSIPDDRTVFKGGNLLDIQLGADFAADPAREKPVPGDVRILVTRRRSPDAEAPGPLAVIYRPKVAGFDGEPVVFTSPTGAESFDVIETSERVNLEYEKTPTGFKAVVTVPLSLAGLAPKSGDRVRMDVGYIFGNATGNKATARAYWSNNGFSANVLDDTPHESRLEPALWGVATFE